MVDRREQKIGWNLDPTDHYPLRWFDGDGWTAQIFDGEEIRTDREFVRQGLAYAGLPSILLFLLPWLILLLMIALAIKGI